MSTILTAEGFFFGPESFFVKKKAHPAPAGS